MSGLLSHAPVAAGVAKVRGRQAQAHGRHLSQTRDPVQLAGSAELAPIRTETDREWWPGKRGPRGEADGRGLHRPPPAVHGRRPPRPEVGRVRHDVRGIEARKGRLVRRRLGHAPEEAALGVRLVGRDVERPLGRAQPADHVEARLVDGALGPLGAVQRDANLVAQLRPLVPAQVLVGLREVVLEQVKEGIVVGVGDARVVQDKGPVRDEGVGRPGALGAHGRG